MYQNYHNRTGFDKVIAKSKEWPASGALSVALQYALPGYSDRRVWVRDPGLPDHCVRL